MKIIESPLKGVYVIEPQVFGDERGFFLETYRASEFEKRGLPTHFVQDNFSRSSKGVLRGLHFQRGTHAQGKLVRVTLGSVFDVAVDVRRDSPTFGKYFGLELSAENKKSMYISPGFAHGFLVLSDTADFQYKCTEYYAPEHEGGIAWNDPDVAIDWPLKNPSLSKKDIMFKKLKDSLQLL